MLRFRPATALAAPAACVALLVAACGEADGPTEPVPPAAGALARDGAPLLITPSELSFVLPPGGSATVTATVQFNGLITAASTDPSCATVTPLSAPAAKPSGSSVYVATFSVTAAGVGNCSITVTDKRGRSVVVPVIVEAPPPPRIVFISDRDGNWELYTMAPDGSGVTRLTSTPETEVAPRLSADGRRLLFGRLVDGVSQVILADHEGSGAVRIPELDGVTEYALSMDGSQVAFVARSEAAYRVGVMAVADRIPSFVSPADLPDAREPAFVPGGAAARVAFTSFQTLWMVNADGTAPGQVTDLDDWTHSVPVHIAVSPDGSLIAFECQPETHVPDICVMNADGTGRVRLTADDVRDAGPVFAPDGRIVFTRRDGATNDSEIWAINVDGTGMVNLSNSPLSHEFTR